MFIIFLFIQLCVTASAQRYPGGGQGTVTSVGLADGSTIPIYSISNSPVTGSGTLTFTFVTQSANTILAGPTSGGASQPTFRSLISSDIPTLAYISTTLGTSAISGGMSVSGNTLSMTQSNTSINGWLSSTDWNTFNGKQASGNYITALTGDVTATGPGSVVATLATVNGNIGSFGSSTSIPSFTVNGKGLITAASGNVVIAPAGTLTGTTLASNVVTSSLTTVGTIGTGTWNGTTIAIPNGGTGQTSASAAFNALSPMTTGGDLIYGGASGAGTRLANGSAGQYLRSAGGTSAPTWTSLPGTFYYAGYYPGSGSNNWSNSNTSYGDFTANGSIPSPTTLVNSNFGTVSNATSNLPGINFSAPRTGTIKITALLTVFPGSSAGTAIYSVELLESTTSTLLGANSGQASANSVNSIAFPCVLIGYMPVTASTTYNFKLQSQINTGTLLLNGVASGAGLTFYLDYIN